MTANEGLDAKKRRSTARNYLKTAKGLVKEGQIERALDLLLVAADLSPPDLDIRAALADAYHRVGRSEEARAAWLQLVAEGSRDELLKWKVHQRLSREAFAKGATEEGLRHLEGHLGLDPSDDAASNQCLQLRLSSLPSTLCREAIDAHVLAFGAPSLADLFRAIYVDRYHEPAAASATVCAEPSRFAGYRDLALAAAEMLDEIGQSVKAVDMLDEFARLFAGDSRFVRRRVKALAAVGAERSLIIQAAEALVPKGTGTWRDRLRKMRLLASIRDWAAVVDEAEALLQEGVFDVDIATLAIRGYTRLERDDEIELLLARCIQELGGGGTADQIALSRIEVAANRPEAAMARLAPMFRATQTRPAVRADYATAVASTGAYASAWLILSEALNFDIKNAGLRSLAVRCAAAMDVVTDPRARFPDALFQRALTSPPPLPLSASDDVVVICTSTLSAGGAERQVALTSTHVADRRGPGRRTILLARDLASPGSAMMRSLIVSRHAEIEDLSDVDPVAVFRTLSADPSVSRSVLKLIVAFPDDIFREVIRLYARFRTARPRVVHLWQDGRISAGAVAAVLAGVPRIVASFRNVAPREDDRRRYRPYLDALYRALDTRSDVIFTANAAAGATDYERVFGMQEGRVRVLRNGVEGDRIRQRAPADAIAAVRKRLGLSETARLVGGVFRLAPAKRPHLWLDVARRIAARDPDVRFVIVGSGVLRDELETLALSYGLSERLVFAGSQSPVEPWIAAMQVMLLVSEVEGLPNVVLEAQALGVAVVATDAGGTSEAILDGETGRLSKDDSAEALASAVCDFLADEDRLARSRLKGPAFIDERFGLDRMVDETMAVYDL